MAAWSIAEYVAMILAVFFNNSGRHFFISLDQPLGFFVIFSGDEHRNAAVMGRGRRDAGDVDAGFSQFFGNFGQFSGAVGQIDREHLLISASLRRAESHGIWGDIRAISWSSE